MLAVFFFIPIYRLNLDCILRVYIQMIASKTLRPLAIKFSKVLLAIVTLLSILPTNSNAQNICYPFIQRKYINWNEVVSGTRQFQSLNARAISNHEKFAWLGAYGNITNGNHADALLLQYNDTGKFLKALRFGTLGANNNEQIYDIQTTSTGSVVVVGSTTGVSLSGASLGFISYFTGNGKLKWTKTTPSYSKTGNTNSDIYNSVHVYNSNTFLAVGEGSQYSGKRNIIITQLDSSGGISWSKNIDLNNTEHHALGATRYGNEWVITGWCRSTQTYPFAIFVNNSGTIRQIWKGQTNGTNQFSRVTVGPNGTIYAVGTSGTGLTSNVLVTAFYPSGNIKWNRAIGANNTQENGQHILVEGANLWVSSTTQTFFNNRIQIFQLDTANGTTVSNSKSLSNGNTNFVGFANARSFDFLKKGGMTSLGIDNAAGVHGNFMINSPCNTNCGTNNVTLTGGNANWTWNTTTYTENSLNSHNSLNFDTNSLNFNTVVNCSQACPLPTKVTTTPLLMCPGQTSVNVNATQTLAETYQWSDGSGSGTRTFTNSGIYYLTTSNACGSRKDTVEIIKATAPIKPNIKDTTFCSVTFSYSVDLAQIGSKYVWDNGSTLPTRTFTRAGVYWIDTRNDCGSRVDSLRLKVIPPPVSPKIPDTAICAAQTLIFDFPRQWTSTYTWPDNDTTLPKTWFTSGDVILKISNACGQLFDTVKVKLVYPPMASLAVDTTYCSRPVSWNVDWTQPGISNYQWYDFNTSPKRTLSYPGKYFLTVSNFCGSFTDTFNILLDTIPVKRLVDNVWFCQGDVYVIKGNQFGGNYKYKWNNGAKVPDIGVAQTGTYILETYNTCGTRLDTVNVFSVRCDCKMWMPNAFTPNGSPGVNDEVRPLFVDDYGNTCGVKTGYWSIYNRWGECVFKERPLSEAWNGIYMDQPLPPGVYIYLINATFDASVTGFRNFSEKGTILLLDASKN